jgi:hypothetical protein
MIVIISGEFVAEGLLSISGAEAKSQCPEM